MSKNLKKILIDVIVAFVCAMLITGLLLYAKSRNKTTEYDEDNAKSEIVFRLYDQDGSCVIYDIIKFSNGESIYNILNRNYLLKVKENAVGKAVIAVDEYETDFTSCYFAFYYKKEGDSDFVYSNYGVERITAEDKMEIELRWTEIKLG